MKTQSYFEEKEVDSSDDESSIVSFSSSNRKSAPSQNSKRHTKNNHYLCTATLYQNRTKLRNVDVFLDGLMDKLLTSCNVMPAYETGPDTSHSSLPLKASRARKRLGKRFKQIRLRRGENIGLELCGIARNIYISNIGQNSSTGLKIGMRIIAISGKPCPDTVKEAIQYMSQGSYDNDGYVTLVTGEDHDYAAAVDDSTYSTRSQFQETKDADDTSHSL